MEILDEGGHDVLEGVGLNRDTINTEHAPIVYASTSIQPCIDDSNTLTLRVSNNVNVLAVLVIDLYFALGA